MRTKDVLRLRDMTGVGMHECKEALEAFDGDLLKAFKFLQMYSQPVVICTNGQKWKKQDYIDYIKNN